MSDTHLQNITVAYPATRVRTRGYLGDMPGIKRAVEARVAIATWNPEVQVSVVSDGQDSETRIKTITKDRTKFTRPFDRAAYDETNVNDDALDTGREDYSVVVPTAGISLGSGVMLDSHQPSIETIQIKARGTWFAIDISVRQGRMKLRKAELDGLMGYEPRRKSYQ